ncbi:MAG: SAM-dependent methyltransferase [Paracoccaceae bacterium]|nr:SAM-dependent methyltransferase [Paracoccaceae bacterium]
MPPELVDPLALARSRARARPDGLFLHREAAGLLAERLSEVNRAFKAPALVGPFHEPFADALGISRCVADDDRLDLSPGAHDLVVHAMGLHWARDPVGQLIQCRRALQPDGLFLAVAFGGRTLHELRSVLAEAEVAVTGGLSPRVAPMGDVRDLGALLQRAGLAMPVADTLTLRVSYPDLFALARDLRAMGETNALADRLRRPTPRAVFERAEALYAKAHQAGNGRILATFELVFLTGWAPAGTQPKPLRPGSARLRLADALGTTEEPTGDPAAPRRD